jgi:cell division protein FtsL
MIKERQTFFQGLFQSKLVLILEVLILVLISAALSKEVINRYQIKGEIKKLQNEVSSLEKKNSDLSGLVTQLSSSTYKEEQARLQLGLQKPGESVMVVLGESTNSSTLQAAQTDSASTPVSTTEKKSNPQRWWDYFFSNSNNKLTS